LVTRLDDAELDFAALGRTEAVLFDVVRPLPTDVVDLPAPTDDRAQRVAEALLDDPADNRTLSQWGRHVGASDRTLMRAFINETGFNQWRTKARVRAAFADLAAGVSVAVVARKVGYTTPSSFGAAFRRTMGATASAYFDAHGGTSLEVDPCTEG
jgi:AraC-like DNA-binding protein